MPIQGNVLYVIKRLVYKYQNIHSCLEQYMLECQPRCQEAVLLSYFKVNVQFCKITPQHIEVELITFFSLHFAKKKIPGF